MKKSGSKSFTLIELLVVISIIGLLSSIIMVSVNGVRKKARDAKRLSDMKQILLALELYYDKNSNYPSNTDGDTGCGGWDVGSYGGPDSGDVFISPLVSQGIIPKVPGDPISTGNCWESINPYYRYYRYGAGTSGCDTTRGAFFVLGINDLETSNRPYLTSPGWSCPSRNWQGEFDWVTGRFEN